MQMSLQHQEVWHCLPPPSSDSAAVFFHLVVGTWQKAWSIHVLDGLLNCSLILLMLALWGLSWQPFLLQIHSLHSIPFDSEKHKKALKLRLTNPSAKVKWTSWGHFKHSTAQLNGMKGSKSRWWSLRSSRIALLCAFPIDCQFTTIV